MKAASGSWTNFAYHQKVPGREVGATVQIIRGRGYGQYAIVVSHDARTLTLDRPWRVVPDTTSLFTCRSQFTETALHANSTVGHSPLVLYYDMVACIVDGQRQSFAGMEHCGNVCSHISESGNAWTDGRPGAMVFNLVRGCSFSGAAMNFNAEDDPVSMPIQLHGADFANFYVENTVARPNLARRAYMIGGEMPTGAVAAVSLWNDHRAMLREGAPRISGGPETMHWGWPRASHLVFAANTFSEAGLGVAIGP